MSVRIRVGAGPFQFEQRLLSTGRLAVHRVRCSGSLEASGSMPGTVASGRSRSAGPVRYDDRPVTTTLPYLRPTGPSRVHAVDADLALVAFDAAELTGFLDRTGPALRDPSSRRAARAAWGLVMDQLLTLTAEEEPTIDDELFDAAAWSVCSAFEDPFAAAGPEARTPRPRALRRALAHADGSDAGRIDVAELAVAAGTSVRTLQALFRRELDTTPHRYLRDLRLDRARAALHADPLPPVAEVAERFGFANLGRFAGYYRERFGENPASARRRSPRV